MPNGYIELKRTIIDRTKLKLTSLQSFFINRIPGYLHWNTDARTDWLEFSNHRPCFLSLLWLPLRDQASVTYVRVWTPTACLASCHHFSFSLSLLCERFSFIKEKKTTPFSEYWRARHAYKLVCIEKGNRLTNTPKHWEQCRSSLSIFFYKWIEGEKDILETTVLYCSLFKQWIE